MKYFYIFQKISFGNFRILFDVNAKFRNSPKIIISQNLSEIIFLLFWDIKVFFLNSQIISSSAVQDLEFLK